MLETYIFLSERQCIKLNDFPLRSWIFYRVPTNIGWREYLFIHCGGGEFYLLYLFPPPFFFLTDKEKIYETVGGRSKTQNT